MVGNRNKMGSNQLNIKYAVYNPQSGQNIFCDTKEEALQEFWKNVVALAISHTYNTAYMVVEQNEDGSEIWRNDNEEVIRKPILSFEIQKYIDAARGTSASGKITVTEIG